MNRRQVGVVLTDRGLNRLEAAIAAAEIQPGKHFTLKQLEALVEEKSNFVESLTDKTIRKIRHCQPVRESSIRLLFTTFDLVLETTDYGLPDSVESEEPEAGYGDREPQPHLEAEQATSWHPSATKGERDRYERPTSQPTRPRGVPFQVPPLPYYFVERPEHQNAVKKLLLGTPKHPGTLVVSAILGLGGIGKSVLAVKLAHDPEVLSRFHDGVLWATLGQQPDILAFLSSWIQSLGDHNYKPITPTAASAHLRTLLADKRMLLVVDDVWHPQHAELFRVGSSDCCVLITTREARIPQAEGYSLDVMSPDQALELITNMLSTPLSEEEQVQAQTFAKRVGYLPLALELTASQIADGVTWTELLEDFQAEVAHLETLDLYSADDIIDDAQRRKYSLTACFRLSLKQLSPEQLQQFAWLGVVPEDVTLTQEMATTLWQVSPRDAGTILRFLSSKALLLQGMRRSCQRPSYRMHDLMHDLAQKLLTNPQHPKQAGELPGLGLTRAEAHSQLIVRYHHKTEQDLWHTLPDDGYIHAQLTWHLEQAEQYDQIHQLLQEETPEGRNGWYEACVALEQTANFVTDVARAWRLAKALYEQSPAQAIALQCRYALIQASLNSLMWNFPPELISVLVEIGTWSPAQGLAHIQRIPLPWQKWRSLEELIPHLPDSLLEEALQVSKGIQDKNLQALAMVYLSTRMPNLQLMARKATEAFSDSYWQTFAWWRLASQDTALWDKAIKSLSKIQKDNQRAGVIRKIAVDMPTVHLNNVLEVSQEIEDIHDLAVAVGAISLRKLSLNQEVLKSLRQENYKLLDRVKEITDIYRRATALVAIAPIFSELWPELLDLLRKINHEAAKVSILKSLIRYIPENFLDEILDITQSFESTLRKASALGTLVKRRPELWQEALEATTVIEDSGLQISVMSHFALEVGSLLPMISNAARGVDRNYDIALALSALASHNSALWTDVLKATRNIRDVYDRARAFENLVSKMPELWQEVLATVQNIQGAIFKVRVLEGLLPKMPELWPVAINTINSLWFERNQAHCLYDWTDRIPDSEIPKAIRIAKSIQSRPEHILALSAFLSKEPNILSDINDPLNPLLFQNGEEYYLTLILGGQALKSPELWPQVITFMENIKSEEQKSIAIQYLASKVPEVLINTLLEICLCIEIDFYRATALWSLLPYVNHFTFNYNRWCEILSALACLNRYILLKRMPLLTKSILDLGGEEALVGAAHAIRDVGRQWR